MILPDEVRPRIRSRSPRSGSASHAAARGISQASMTSSSVSPGPGNGSPDEAAARERWIGGPRLAYKRWGRGERVGAATFRKAPRPSALAGHRTRTRMVSMPTQASGMRRLASRDAGLLPVGRTPRAAEPRGGAWTMQRGDSDRYQSADQSFPSLAVASSPDDRHLSLPYCKLQL